MTYPLDVNDAEHQEWRAAIDKLVAQHRGVVDLRTRIDLDSVDLTEQETRVDLGAA